MITFEELKERTTPDIIKKMVELAEGFGYMDYVLSQSSDLEQMRFNNIIFPLLLHRAVEGWNKINPQHTILVYSNGLECWSDSDEPPMSLNFKDYELCHLTQCEMAIWDCLLNIL